ncbi:SDR family oxidoreductase [Aetokthonos hydrillicola Thurmond2011]|jgi:nucleoside-diphosphate-sugar epimerase|uniref:SDR family oxidoreductase n=1 Tax=Aetokthonos hydrillicola Thurmond2011 TaxID=2712845 RepID=A0AAP5MCV4_9CYAN|nr:SDR family oxidoreductase [Aetokthonos hydrillicola]MBO3459884.1 SDR family oxidoreductase [Aetokthonos hydrillicola CCALA 1050]MBW4584001.1 SDR family oxidoreductase [Aetokthonos hydrillicola CCALA 1050]MDR9898803.1 SDR family oxidoreductase [Aetokthonos hydrillicola Thurmond2011]
MNIAIIGCGYVGCKVAEYWQQEKSFVVTATTTSPERVPTLEAVAQKVEVLKGSDAESLKSILKNQETVLLSVAAKGADFYQETYLHTAQTLVSVLKQIPSVQHLIYTGSYSVYGDKNGEWVDEESPVAPTNVSGEILSKTEQVLLSANSQSLRVCILRLGGIYGPNRELVKIFSRYAGTTRPGDGEDVTNWVHLDDIVAAIEFVREKKLEGIYNLVDDAHLRSRELLNQIFEKHSLPNVTWDPTQKSTRPYNARVSNQKIKDAGYQLIHPQMIF